MFLRMVDLTAVKRHWPQHICPQGVRVALVGGEKQMGHVYVESGSGTGVGGTRGGDAFGDATIGSSESESSMRVGWSTGGSLSGTTSGGISHVEI